MNELMSKQYHPNLITTEENTMFDTIRRPNRFMTALKIIFVLGIIAYAALHLMGCGGGGGGNNCSAGTHWDDSLKECRPDVVVDTTSPVVTMTTPGPGTTVSGMVTLTAFASDSESGVEGVQFEVNGTPVCTNITASPYQYSWNSASVANGSYQITAFASDNAGNTKRSTAITITVNNVSVTPPAAPTNLVVEKTGATQLTAHWTINATQSVVTYLEASTESATSGYASSPEIPGTSFIMNGVPLDLSWIRVRNCLFSDRTICSGYSNVVMVDMRVIPPVDNTAPTVSISSPSSGTTLTGTVTLTASASDTESGVASVQFMLDGNNLGSPVTSAPYQLNWNSTTVVNGSFTLTALATDVAGNTRTSAGVTITVNNTALTLNPPINVVATEVPCTTDSTKRSVKVTWTENSGAANSLIDAHAFVFEVNFISHAMSDGFVGPPITEFVESCAFAPGDRVMVSVSSQTTHGNVSSLSANSNRITLSP